MWLKKILEIVITLNGFITTRVFRRQNKLNPNEREAKLDLTTTIDYQPIISSKSTGNTSLQLGHYITKEDIAKRRGKVCDFDFIDK